MSTTPAISELGRVPPEGPNSRTDHAGERLTDSLAMLVLVGDVRTPAVTSTTVTALTRLGFIRLPTLSVERPQAYLYMTLHPRNA